MWNSTQVGWSETPAQFRGRASEKGSGSPWEGGSCRSPPKSRRGPSSAHHCALPAPELPVVIRSIVSRPWQHNGPWDFQTRLHSLEAGTEAAGMGIRVVIQKGRTDQHVTAVTADLQKTWWAVICRGPCLGLDRWFPVPDPSGRSSVVRSGGGAVINPFKYQFLHW